MNPEIPEPHSDQPALPTPPDDAAQQTPPAGADAGGPPQSAWAAPGPYQTGNLPAASESEILSMWAAAQATAAAQPRERADIWWMKTLVGAATAIVIAALGFPLGWLWSTVAPKLPVVLSDGAAYYADPEGEQRGAQEGWFIVLSIGGGILLAIVLWLALRRFRGPVTVAALAVGSVVAGWLTWRFGHNIGRGAALAAARHGANGTTIQFPVDLRIKNAGSIALWHGWLPYVSGDLIFFAVAALATYLFIVGFSVNPTLGVHKHKPTAAQGVDPAAP